MLVLLYSCGPDGKKITKQEYGEKWPLTVNEGYISCHNSAIVFECNDKLYPVNGTAKSRYDTNSKYNDISEIWAYDDELNRLDGIQKYKKDITPIIEAGLKICE